MSEKGDQSGTLLLGAVLDASNAVLKTSAGALLDMSGLRASDHQDKRVQTAWSIAERLVVHRRPVDATTVFATGRATGSFQEADLAWLHNLQTSNTLDGQRFAVVAEQFRRRIRGGTLALALAEAQRALKGGADPVEVSSRLQGVVEEVAVDQTHDGTGDEDVLEIGNEWEARQRDEPGARPLRLPTGMLALDTAIGGFAPNLVVICGLPSVGKSALLGSCLMGQLKLGIKPGLFGLEDGTSWLAERIIADELGIPVGDVGDSKLEGEVAARYPEVMQATMNLLRPLICFRRESIGAVALVRRAAHWIQNLGVQCVWIDHGGEIDHERLKDEDYRLSVGRTYQRLRDAGVRYKTPFVSLAHTTRESDRGEAEERPPLVKEIAESAYIERRARQILGLWDRRSKYDELRVTVLKNTKGERWRTYAIKRKLRAALVDGNQFEEVFLQSERREELKKAKLERAKDRLEVKAAEDELKPKKKPAPQLTLEVLPGGAAE